MLSLPAEDLLVLAHTAPSAECVPSDEAADLETAVLIRRSPTAGPASGLRSDHATRSGAIANGLRSGPPSALAQAWATLVVRSLSARSYDFPFADQFYDQRMRDMSAAEHTAMALLARDGARVVYPRHTHGDSGTILAATACVDAVIEVSDRLVAV